MKKRLLVFCFLLLSLSFIFAGLHSTIPLDHQVYRILKSAELKALIEPLSSTKPYIVSDVLTNLKAILSSKSRLTTMEAEQIEKIISDLTPNFNSANDGKELFRSGSYSEYYENIDLGVQFGIKIEAEATISLLDFSELDSRNAGLFYFSSDIKDFLSIYMDIGIRLDQLNNRVFLATDFTIPGEGHYSNLLEGGGIASRIPFDAYRTSYYLAPELSTSFLDGRFQLRWGSYKRDWGPGLNNFQLAGSARPFDAIEATIEFSDWLHFSFLTGSLGIFSLKEIDGEEFFSDSLHYRNDNHSATPYGNFNSNISAQRIELSLPFNITFGIFETIIYQKRFELGYLNPFNVYMFQQNSTGDYDNLLAGIDLQWQIKNIGKIYAAAATSEMHEISPSVFFTHPRNIMALQAGFNIALPIGIFSSLTFQYTQLDPFFYSHYRHYADKLHPIYQNDNVETIPDFYLETAYVNKGENLGYPLNPNSDELLVHADIGLGDGWNTSLTVKYQRRSAQYGYKVSQAMQYDTVEYELEKFDEHLFQKTFFTKIGVSKTFSQFPLTVYGSYQLQRITSRDISNPTAESGVRVEDDGRATVFTSGWNDPMYKHAFQIGVSIYR